MTWRRATGWALVLGTAWLLLPAPLRAADGVPGEMDLLRDPIQLLESLEKQRQSLDERAKWLDLREQELKRLEEKIAKRIAALQSLREAIQQDLTREQEIDNANVARLAKIYAGMKPKAAAAQLQELDRAMAVKVLKVMPEKTAAKILARMDTPIASQLGEALGIPIAERRSRSR